MSRAFLRLAHSGPWASPPRPYADARRLDERVRARTTSSPPHRHHVGCARPTAAPSRAAARFAGGAGAAVGGRADDGVRQSRGVRCAARSPSRGRTGPRRTHKVRARTEGKRPARGRPRRRAARELARARASSCRTRVPLLVDLPSPPCRARPLSACPAYLPPIHASLRAPLPLLGPCTQQQGTVKDWKAGG
jgi:hypothetical protein